MSSQPSYWVVRASDGLYTSQFVNGSFIGIGWEEIGNPLLLTDEQIREGCLELYGGNRFAAGQGVGMILRFVRELVIGDIVMTPDYPHDAILVGRVVSDPYYIATTDDACPYMTRRQVEWFSSILRNDIKSPLRQGLQSSLTIFNLDKYREQLERLLDEGTAEAVVPPPTSDDMVPLLIERFYTIHPKEFEGFVLNVLQTIGFEGETTRYSQDGGKDIEGSLNVGGILQVPVKVQVKRMNSKVGNEVVTSLRGILHQDEFGILVNPGGFTAAARRAAEAEGLKTISLVDGPDLCRLIFENYDDLEHVARQQLGLTRVFRVV